MQGVKGIRKYLYNMEKKLDICIIYEIKREKAKYT